MGGSLTPEYYYESIDMDDALHPQTMLAYGLNGQGPADCQRRADSPASRAAAWLQARQVCDAHRARRELCEYRRRQGRILGRQRLSVVRRHLKRWALLLLVAVPPAIAQQVSLDEGKGRRANRLRIGRHHQVRQARSRRSIGHIGSDATAVAPHRAAPAKFHGAAARRRGCRGRSAPST